MVLGFSGFSVTEEAPPVRQSQPQSHGWLERGLAAAGMFLPELKRYEEAFAAYDKALTLKPDLAGAWLGRGNVFTQLKRYEEAFAAYDKALALEL